VTALSGVLPITLTPFTDDGEVDEASIDTLVEDYLGAGAHGLTILGIMGEAARLLDEERERVLRRYLQGHRRPGAGRRRGLGAGHRDGAGLRPPREDAGAAAVMLAPPDNTRTSTWSSSTSGWSPRRCRCRSWCRTSR
jgi:4-hydroxy-tetrahydrodipicolinate synthase